MRLIPALVVLCGITVAPPVRCQQTGYRAGSLPSDQPQPVYAKDPQDSWNRIFYFLFTRTVKLRLTDDFREEGPFQPAHFGAFPAFHSQPVSDRLFERVESGDRAIDPLYPSFLDSLGTVRLMTEPRYSEFEKSMRAAIEERGQRTPVERALMQSDLWAAYDIIYSNLRWVDAARSTLMLKTLARMIRKLALSQEEIAALPNNYAAGTSRLDLPDVFGEHSPWIEIEWGQGRLHDSAANYRRSTRVFLNPGTTPIDQRNFLEEFRENRTPHAPLKAVALITQSLIIDKSGDVVPSGTTTEVQVREFKLTSDGRLSKTEIAEFELSRRAMLTEPASGGLVRFEESAPAYLPASGNDYSFASGIDSSDGRVRDTSILGSLRARCGGCHGPNVATLFTFSKHDPQAGEIRILRKQANEHGRYVIEQKKKLGSWKSLQENWAQD